MPCRSIVPIQPHYPMIPTDPHLTKLRLIAERAERLYIAAEKVRQEEIKAAIEKAYAVEIICQQAWSNYYDAMREKGYCASCGETLSACGCILLARDPDETPSASSPPLAT